MKSLSHLSNEELRKKYRDAIRKGDKGMVNMCYGEAKEREEFNLNSEC